MSYLDQFCKHLDHHDYASFLTLWEEYCMGDEVDGEELRQVLKSVKESELSLPFGRHVEKALTLWEKIKGSDLGHEILKLIFDLQTTNTVDLGKLALNYLLERYPNDPYLSEKMRLIGLRDMQNFQGAVSNYELLTHMKKGCFVFHTGGWGVGEIVDVSFIREELSLEFDYVADKKDLSFENAFRTLLPIPDEHFLALRFGKPDELEERAKKNPVETIHMLLRDMGPLTASEIKEELCELVIPEKEWTRWWQTTRAKIKRDTLIATPDSIRAPFKLRKSEVLHEDRLEKALAKSQGPKELTQLVYAFLRDFPHTLKNDSFGQGLEKRLIEALSASEITDAQELQLHFLLEDLKGEKEYQPIKELIKRFVSPEEVVKSLDVIAFKKRTLLAIRELRPDWDEVFLKLLLMLEQNPLRDYILNELIKESKEEQVAARLRELLAFPSRHPQAILWYSQKIFKNDALPLGDQEGKNLFFEALLILLSSLEQLAGFRDLNKKIIHFLTTGRYSNVRKVFKGAAKSAVQEFLLLATKCQSLSDHDIKIFHSLAEVVHPSLAKLSKKYGGEKETEVSIIWTTQQGYEKTKARIERISTIETVENAREIEEARALGDLRENAEYKAATEKRSHLQRELRNLSRDFNQARILTRADINSKEVGVGVVFDCVDREGKQESYTILGPWEADPENHILSFQSKLAHSLIGRKAGETISIQGKELTITALHNYFDKQ